MTSDRPRRLVAEAIGTMLLLAAVVGSGIMADRLSGGNQAIALLANTIATGAALIALILTFGPVSGAHFNPAVSIADASQGGLSWADAGAYIVAQLLGAFLGVGLACVWIAMWAAHVFGGWPTPVEPEAFKLIAALDLSLMAPALVLGGVLSWRRQPWGYVASAIASGQAGLYLLVLSVNSIVAIARGFVEAPGELPIWGALTLITVTVVGILFANVSDDRCEVRP
jgi:glycerol uptake facilitator-like aquaporin